MEDEMQFYIIAGILVLVVALGITTVVLLTSQHSNAQPLQVTSTVEKEVMPDEVTVTVSVVTVNKSISTALQENTEKSNVIINAFKNNPKLTIETTKYSITPKEEWNPDLKEYINNGYQVYNTIKLKTKDINLTGSIISEAIALGGNRIEGISYTISRDARGKITNELISDAVNKAKERANILAKLMKKRIRGIENINIQQPYFPVYYRSYKAEASGTTPDIEPQLQKITLTAVVSFKI